MSSLKKITVLFCFFNLFIALLEISVPVTINPSFDKAIACVPGPVPISKKLPFLI